jgi:hypothetical protein
VDVVARNGGMLSLNHPVDGDCSWQWHLARKPTHAEIMHSSWQETPQDTSIWAWWNAWGTRTIPLGGSDFHKPNDGVEVGTPTTWVSAPDPGHDSILTAAIAGHTALSMGTAARGPVLVRVEDELIAIDADGAIFLDIDGRRRMVTRSLQPIKDTGHGPYRLEGPDRRILAISA